MIIEHKEIRFKGKIIFEKIRLTNDFHRIPKILVEDEACFVFITQGSFQYRTPTHLQIIKEGNALLSKCGNYFYEQELNTPETEVISAIGTYFHPAIIKILFQSDLSIPNLLPNFDVKTISVEPLLKSYVESINYLLDHPELADDDLILNKLKEVILLLSKSENAPSIHAFVTSLFVPYEYTFHEIIQKNLYANLSLDEFAKLCHCSVATFKRKFESAYHESPAKYMLQKKLERARQLLVLPSKPISEIAYECGFETPTSFNKAFKKQYGKAPSAYRVS